MRPSDKSLSSPASIGQPPVSFGTFLKLLRHQSQQRFEEACTTYEVMEGVWPGEPRIRELRDLVVH